MSSGKKRVATTRYVPFWAGGRGSPLFELASGSDPRLPTREPAAEQGVTLLNSRYEGWEGAKRIWTLEAAEIFRTPDGETVNFRGIENIRLYQEDDRSSSHKCRYRPGLI